MIQDRRTDLRGYRPHERRDKRLTYSLAITKGAGLSGADAHVQLSAIGMWHVGKTCFYSATRPLLPQHDGTALIVAHDVE